MATIIINAITYRTACTDGRSAEDITAYDGASDAFFSRLGEAAKAEGFGFEVDADGRGAASYRVTNERDPADYEAAHEFMQADRADFWAQF